jgi:iron complex transport system substrate-binding protein
MNKTIKWTTSLILVVAVMLSMVGCSTRKTETVTVSVTKTKSVTTTVEKTATVTQAATHIVTDDLGREVEVPNNPQRVLALKCSMIETLFDLGIVPVGLVDEFEIYHAESEGLPNVGQENSPNIEIITQLTPDLIIAQARNHGDMLESLEGTGAAVVFVDPSSYDDQLIGGIALIGEVLNRQTEAETYLARVQQTANDLRSILAESPIKTALFIQGGNESIMAAQSFCFWGQLLTYLGLENITGENIASSKSGFVAFDIETIIQKDPDVILILQPGFRSSSSATSSISEEDLLAMYCNDAMWQGLTAVKEGRIVIVPINVSTGKMNIIDALCTTAKLVYPEGF